MGTYLPFPRWKLFFLGVLVDLLEPSLELFSAEYSAFSPPEPSPRDCRGEESPSRLR